ncbi:MAG TPA: GNAT family N-acetyltransferase, partial [Isosphaeraceae bacterium]|nr:GNAT family N-acetyltransferase [Isosphaeraceae bacterium]
MSDRPPLDVNVRDATHADHATIVLFNAQLALESEQKRLDPGVLGTGVEIALANPDHLRYWVAETNGQVIGQAAVTREWSDWRNGWIWWLQSVYIHADFRARGVFRALFEHIR